MQSDENNGLLEQTQKNPQLTYQPPQLIELESTDVEGGANSVPESTNGVLMDGS